MIAALQVAVLIAGTALMASVFIGLPFAWGMDSLLWAKANSLPRYQAYLRSVALPLSVGGIGWWLAGPGARPDMAPYLALLAAVVAALAGARWESRFWKEEQKTVRCWDEGDHDTD
jgi:hypothetical protein